MSRTLRDQRMNDPLPAEIDWRVRVFDSLSFPTLIMTPDKKIQSANRIFLQKYGMTMDQVVNKNCTIFKLTCQLLCLINIIGEN